MKISRRNLCCTALLCSFFLLTSCSSHKAPGNSELTQGAAYANGETAYMLPSGDVEDVEVTPAEPEESASEEIADLDKLGPWEDAGDAMATGYVLSGYDFPVVMNRQVNYYLELFQGKQREMFGRWLSRSMRYAPEIEKELGKAGLPRDLAFLAMIESGYNPSAVSRVGAGGLWQFMPATGRTYDLAINSWVDERREPAKATKAAIRYLSKLYQEFNDWHLAVAAYNTGEGKVERAIREHGVKDFWQLSARDGLYTETKRYVPKLIAAIIIARNPAAYGFGDITPDVAPSHEVVQVPGLTSLSAVAEVTGTSLRHLRSLNNELRRDLTPPQSRYSLRVPAGSRGVVLANIDRLQRRPAAPRTDRPHYATHVVKRGETLHAISRRYNVSMTNLLKVNHLHVSQLLAGQRLRVPVSGAVLAQKGKQAHDSVAAGVRGTEKRSYRVQKGDTLSAIARRNGVSVAQLQQWNKLKKGSVQAGQPLTLHKPASATRQVALTASSKVGTSTKKVAAIQPAAKTSKVAQTAKKIAPKPVRNTRIAATARKAGNSGKVVIAQASKTGRKNAVRQLAGSKKAAPKKS